MNSAYEFLENEIKLNKDDVVVSGISGGPDSMCLLYLLIELKKKHNFKLIVAHVNHNMRKEALDEANYVKDYALKNDLIFEYFEIPNDNHEFLKEAESRKYRYDFFESLIKKYKANYLFTAHHGDDLVETILMRIVRGSSLRGYSGFPRLTNKGSYKIVRPLITITKDEITKFLDEKNIKYAYDYTNDSMDYTRNRYRKKMLPFLKEEDKDVHLKFKKFSETLKLYDDFIKNILKEEKPKLFKNNVLDLNGFNKLDYLIKRELLYEILSDVIGDDLILTENLLNNLMNSICSKKPNVVINISNKHNTIKEYDKLYFDKDIHNNDYNINIEKETIIPSGIIKMVDESNNNSNYVTRLNSKELKMPLYVRNRRNSDRMVVKGISKNKKLKDIFTNEKIPISIRNVTPVVVDSDNNIVWLPGIKKSVFDKKDNEEYDIILQYFEGGNNE